LFAGTSSGLYESQDGGNVWGRVLDGRLNVNISSVIFLDSTGTRILAADNTFGGVLLSEDAGDRWEKIEDPEFSSPARTLMQDSSHPSIIYVGTGTEGVYRLSVKALQSKRQVGSNDTKEGGGQKIDRTQRSES